MHVKKREIIFLILEKYTYVVFIAQEDLIFF